MDFQLRQTEPKRHSREELLISSSFWSPLLNENEVSSIETAEQPGVGGVHVGVDERRGDERAVEVHDLGVGMSARPGASWPTQTTVPSVTAMAVASGELGVWIRPPTRSVVLLRSSCRTGTDRTR